VDVVTHFNGVHAVSKARHTTNGFTRGRAFEFCMMSPSKSRKKIAVNMKIMRLDPSSVNRCQNSNDLCHRSGRRSAKISSRRLSKSAPAARPWRRIIGNSAADPRQGECRCNIWP
ncbi:MAG: hypothetical protein WBP18_07330, partial [Paracoccaceae bacterium]